MTLYIDQTVSRHFILLYLDLWNKDDFHLTIANALHFTLIEIYLISGLLWWLSDKESTRKCRRCGFDPWVRKTLCRKKWQPTPVFLPGKSHWQRRVVGYSLWGCRELDTTEQLNSEADLNVVNFCCIANINGCGGVRARMHTRSFSIYSFPLRLILKSFLNEGSRIQGALFMSPEASRWTLCPLSL